MNTGADRATVGPILIVDDEPALRRASARILTAAGYEVDCAADGLEALRMLDDRRYAAVVSDVMMPRLDGLGLLREIRARGIDLRMVLVTGAPSRAAEAEAIAAGAFQYLSKPLTFGELQRIVGEAVSGGAVGADFYADPDRRSD
jgi:DNA-binding NtrC family response regulator